MKISKVKLGTLISMNRDYWNEGGEDGELIQAQCRAIFVYANKTFGDELGAILQDIVGGILKHRGLKPDATNEDIYKMFEALGYEVTE